MAKDARFSSSHVSSLFWDGFEAAGAMDALTRSGFTSNDVSALGTLAGRIPDLDRCLLELGLTPSESAYYTEYFDEGALLLVVHTDKKEQREAAARVLRRHGGLLPSLPVSENRGGL